jgi:hypothetical protein
MAPSKSRTQEADTFTCTRDFHCLVAACNRAVMQPDLPVCFPAAQRASVKVLELIPPPTVTKVWSVDIESVFSFGR